jgi:hypothetical protein
MSVMKKWLGLSATEANGMSKKEVSVVRECLVLTLSSWGVAELITNKKVLPDDMSPVLVKMNNMVDAIYQKLENQPASALLSATCYYLIKAQSAISTAFKIDKAVRPRMMGFLAQLTIMSPGPLRPVATETVNSMENIEAIADMMTQKTVDDAYEEAMPISAHSANAPSIKNTVGQAMFHMMAGTALAAVALVKLHLNDGRMMSLLSLDAGPEDSQKQ